MPGVLVDHQIMRLSEGKNPSIKIKKEFINTSSIDLPVGRMIYQVASEPTISRKGFCMKEFIENFTYNELDTAKGFVTLTPGSVYIAEIDCHLNLPSAVFGHANAKSTTGRNGVHSKIIAEEGTEYDAVPKGYSGKLYVAITPVAFSKQIKRGYPLVQLRLIDQQRQFVSGFELEHIHRNETIAVSDNQISIDDSGLALHLSLTGNPSNLVAKQMGRPIPSWEKGMLDPRDFFTEKSLYDNALFVEPGTFLLAKTQELIRTPRHLCAELQRINQSIGEISWHDAGFVDPCFGLTESIENGSTVVLEITNFGRAPVQLEEGRKVGILRFEELAALPSNAYGQMQLGGVASNYQGQQEITPAKQFKAWQ